MSPGQRRDTSVRFELFSSAFCGACRQTRAVLDRAAGYIPGSEVVEHAIESAPDLAATAGIDATPTVIVRRPDGSEVFRASGVPTIHQVLTAGAHALEHHNLKPEENHS